jgi:phosphoserine phosphatase RsbU/P
LSDGSHSPSSSADVVDAGIDFEDLFETAPCGYVLADRDGRITRANQTFAQWTGYPGVTLIGRRFSDLLPVVGKIFYETHFVPMLHIQGRFTEVALEIVAADGQKIPVIVNAGMRNEPDGVGAIIRFTLFVSAERRSYERGLLAARNEAQATVLAPFWAMICATRSRRSAAASICSERKHSPIAAARSWT